MLRAKQFVRNTSKSDRESMFDNHTRFMQYALREAEAAKADGEVPVGCVITYEEAIIGKAHNLRETLQDPTAHAEVLAITQAAQHMGSWRLEETRLYVTLEPCAMCAGAIILSRIPEVYFGAFDPKAGACGSVVSLLDVEEFNHHPTVSPGLLADECGAILSGFFRDIRARREKPRT